MKLFIPPSLALLGVGERPLCRSQPGEAPACQFCPPQTQMSPQAFPLWWAFRAACAVTNPSCMEWPGHLLLVLICPCLGFLCSQHRARLKKQIPLFLVVSPPLCPCIAPFESPFEPCFPGCQSFSCGAGDSRRAGDH